MPRIVTSSGSRRRRLAPKAALGAALFAALAAVAWALLRHPAEQGVAAEAPGPRAAPSTAAAAPARSPVRRPAGEQIPRMTPNGRRRVPALRPLAEAVQAAAAGEADGTNDEQRAEVYTTPVVDTSDFPMATEQLLTMILSCGDTMAPPPLPITDDGTLERHLAMSLTNAIVIYDTDDERTVALKENVAQAKLQLKEVMDSGGSVAEALREYLAYVGENHQLRERVVAEYSRLKREVSPEAAEEYLAAANAELEAEGITPVTVQRKRRSRPGGQ